MFPQLSHRYDVSFLIRGRSPLSAFVVQLSYRRPLTNPTHMRGEGQPLPVSYSILSADHRTAWGHLQYSRLFMKR